MQSRRDDTVKAPKSQSEKGAFVEFPKFTILGIIFMLRYESVVCGLWVMSIWLFSNKMFICIKVL